MLEEDKQRLRRLLDELAQAGEPMPRDKTGTASALRRLGREAEAARIEAGAGFSLVAAAGGEVDIISGGRREALGWKMPG